MNYSMHLVNTVEEELSINSQFDLNLMVYEMMVAWREALRLLGSHHYYLRFQPRIISDECHITEGRMNSNQMIRGKCHLIHQSHIEVRVASTGIFRFSADNSSEYDMTMEDLFESIQLKSSKAGAILDRIEGSRELITSDVICIYDFKNFIEEIEIVTKQRANAIDKLIDGIVPYTDEQSVEMIAIKGQAKADIAYYLVEKYEVETDCSYRDLCYYQPLIDEANHINRLTRSNFKRLLKEYNITPYAEKEAAKVIEPEPEIIVPKAFSYERTLITKSKAAQMGVNLDDIFDDPEEF